MARQVHDVHGRDRLPPAVFLELEIGGGQVPDGLPVPAGHADGNLDDGHPRVRGRRPRGRLREGDGEAGTDSNKAGQARARREAASSRRLPGEQFPRACDVGREEARRRRSYEALEGRPAESRVSLLERHDAEVQHRIELLRVERDRALPAIDGFRVPAEPLERRAGPVPGARSRSFRRGFLEGGDRLGGAVVLHVRQPMFW
jgi:hypothetical protein